MSHQSLRSGHARVSITVSSRKTTKYSPRPCAGRCRALTPPCASALCRGIRGSCTPSHHRSSAPTTHRLHITCHTNAHGHHPSSLRNQPSAHACDAGLTIIGTTSTVPCETTVSFTDVALVGATAGAASAACCDPYAKLRHDMLCSLALDSANFQVSFCSKLALFPAPKCHCLI